MANELHLEILPAKQKALFESLDDSQKTSGFYLAGGTALALQIGHRRSIDFDFFSEKEFETRLIKRTLARLGRFELFSESKGTLNGRLNGVEISFFWLPYPLIVKGKKYGNINIASKEDIAAMKLAALSSRGNRKDFVDLYFLLDDFSLSDMVGFFEAKYGPSEENVYCVLKGLAYFADAEEQAMPKMLKKIGWKEIKKRITQAHKVYLNSLRG